MSGGIVLISGGKSAYQQSFITPIASPSIPKALYLLIYSDKMCEMS